ncbi:hypothetical protein K443DRAFT_347462 [Laccaria amethystina LaAM-08-1]|uniref:Uncharacterized protein n=1 Tax=Laccaria amethystina LaAM-08-1 TaxID=1095629 RepID=A0A0C9XAU1_9AGAR|nr:hypothetical protein K443DRAFT_347462 [Laccaria amethystina LaAM-08-1]
MSLSARRSCTLPKPKGTSATTKAKQPCKPQYDEKYVQRFLGFWKQGKNDRKACLAFVKLHPTCDRHSCKSKPQTCTRHTDGISCGPCRSSRIRCPRLQAFLLDYVSVHLGVSSKTALDLYERYARERRGVQKEKHRLQEEAEKQRAQESGDDDGDLSDPSLAGLSSEEEEESSDGSDYRITTKTRSKGTPATNRSKGTPATTTTTKSLPPSSARSIQDKDLHTTTAAAAAVTQLQIATMRVLELEADLSKLKKERNGMLEREKAYTLKAMAAASQPPPQPSLDEITKLVEAELLKRKEIYRKEVMEEWDRLHENEVERLRRDRLTPVIDSCSTTTITIPRTSIGLHMAVRGFLETMAAEEGSSRLLDLLQWITEFSQAVKEVDELSNVRYTNGSTTPKRATNFNEENGEEMAKRRRLNGDAH